MIWRYYIHKMVLRLLDSLSNWNLEMLVFEERGKLEYPEKNHSEPRREPTTNSTHIWRRHRDLNPGHIGGRWALPPLRHPLLHGLLILASKAFWGQNAGVMKNAKVSSIVVWGHKMLIKFLFYTNYKNEWKHIRWIDQFRYMKIYTWLRSLWNKTKAIILKLSNE